LTCRFEAIGRHGFVSGDRPITPTLYVDPTAGSDRGAIRRPFESWPAAWRGRPAGL